MAMQLNHCPDSGLDPLTAMKLGALVLHDQANAKVESPATTRSKSTATYDALSTTELLEPILSHLSVEDLVLLRCVSCHWRDTMAGSLVLRRAMFLGPGPELPFEWHLQSVALGQAWKCTKKPSGNVPKPGETVLQSSRFNSILFERRPGVESEGFSYGGQSVRLYARNNIFAASRTKLFTQMFIAQPPVTHALVDGTIHFEPHKENGIRVADIIQALKQNYDYSYGLHRNILSLVVLKVMFPSTDQEKEALVVRPHRPMRDLYPLRAHDSYTW